MKLFFCFSILATFCSCSNLRPKESCTDETNWNYYSDISEDSNYKNLNSMCESQHGIVIDRDLYSKFIQEKKMEILKKNCTCENGFLTQAAHQHPNDPQQKEFAEKCKTISMDIDYLRGVELAKSSIAKKKTEEEMQKTQTVSPETIQLFCKK